MLFSFLSGLMKINERKKIIGFRYIQYEVTLVLVVVVVVVVGVARNLNNH